MVSVLAFYSDDPSSIPAEVYNFFCKIVVENNENKQKEAGVGPIFKKNEQKANVNDLLVLMCILRPRFSLNGDNSYLRLVKSF